MINETFLRQSISDIHKGLIVYIYNEKFVPILEERYIQKYKDENILIKKYNGYYLIKKLEREK